MKKNFLLMLTVVFLAGCISPGFGSPWDRHGYDRPAESAPNPLSVETADYKTEDTVATYQEAGIEYTEESAPVLARNTATTREYYSPPQSPAQQPSASSQQQYMRAVQVGFLVPLSGEHADLGKALFQAAQMALFDLGYSNFVLLPRDTKGSPEGAQQAALSAINDGAELIIGPLFSGSVQAAKPVAARKGINMMAFSTDWSQAGGNTFIMGFLPFAQVQRVTQYALSQNIRNIAVLAPNTDYGNAVIASYHSLSYRLGLPTAEVVRFPADESDISGIIRSFTKYDERVELLNQEIQATELKLAAAPNNKELQKYMEELKKMDTWGEPPFEAILLPVGGDQARSIANLLSYYDMGPNDVKRLGTGLWDDAGLSSEQSMRGAWYAAPSQTTRQDFEKRYRSLYGSRPPRLATLAYDATALAAVLARSGYRMQGRPAFDRTSIMNPNGFAGLDGVFRFRPDGLIERGLAIMEIQSGSVKEIDQPPRTFQLETQYSHR